MVNAEERLNPEEESATWSFPAPDGEQSVLEGCALGHGSAGVAFLGISLATGNGFIPKRSPREQAAAWNQGTISAGYIGSQLREIDKTRASLVISYDLENNTDSDYRLADGPNVVILSRLKSDGSYSQDQPIRLSYPVFLPARQHARLAVERALGESFEGPGKVVWTREFERGAGLFASLRGAIDIPGGVGLPCSVCGNCRRENIHDEGGSTGGHGGTPVRSGASRRRDHCCCECFFSCSYARFFACWTGHVFSRHKFFCNGRAAVPSECTRRQRPKLDSLVCSRRSQRQGQSTSLQVCGGFQFLSAHDEDCKAGGSRLAGKAARRAFIYHGCPQRQQSDALIDPAGKVTTVKVISGPVLLQQAAVETVRQWKYEPARLDGQAVAMHLTVTVRFRLN